MEMTRGQRIPAHFFSFTPDDKKVGIKELKWADAPEFLHSSLGVLTFKAHQVLCCA